MEDKKNKYFIGKIEKHAQNKGWFFGHFMEDELLKNDAVEIAWQDISNLKPTPGDKHYHKLSVEINIVLSGTVRLTINGERKTVAQGEFYVIYPYTEVEAVEADNNTHLIIIRAPSLKGDKYQK